MVKQLFVLLLFLLSGSAFAETLYTFNGGGTSGAWNATSSWTTDPTGSTSQGARIPQNGDNLVITNSYVVQLTADVATTGLTLTIQKGGTLDLGTATFTNTTALTRLGGQGVLRVGQAYFPVVANNDFDDAGTGTVEFYNWATSPAALPVPASNMYNNLRLLNSSASTAYVAQLGRSLTINGTLVLTRATSSAAAVSLTLGPAAAGTNVTLTLNSDLTVGAGTSLGVTPAAGVHSLRTYGSITNNGSMALHNGTTDDTQRADLYCLGTADANLVCNGPTYLSRLYMQKGTGAKALLNVTSAATSPAGGNLRFDYVGGSDLVILEGTTAAGTLKLGPNIVLPRLSNSTDNYNLGSSAKSTGLWVAGATIRLNNSAALVVYGTFRLSDGRMEVNRNGGEGAVIREDGEYIIEGGTMVVTKFRPSNTSANHRGSFTLTGGTFEATGSGSDADYARFSLPYRTQSFRMTGGTLRVANPAGSSGGFHIGVNPDNAYVTGGLIELDLPATATNFKILSTAPLWNLTILKPASGGAGVALLDSVGVTKSYKAGATTMAQPLTVLNNFTLGTNSPTFNANGKDLTIQGTFVVSSGATYLPTGNTTRFGGGQNQLFTNNGTIGANTSQNSLANLTIDKTAGTLTLDGTAATLSVAGTLNLLNGVLNDGGKTVRALGNLVNSASHTSGGGAGSITLAGSSAQTIGGNGNGVFGNLTINSTAPAGVAVTLTAEQGVASVLTLQSNHILSISTNQLSLTSISPMALVAGPGGFSATRMIQTAGNQSDGGLRKTYGGADSFVFAVGVGSKYTPATIGLSKALPLYGKVSVSPVNTRNPFVTSSNALAYYWKVRSADFGPIPASSLSLVFTGLNSDATTGTLANYVPSRYLPTAWGSTGTTAQVVKSASTFDAQFPNQSKFEGEYTAGEPAAFGAVTTFYSIRDGNWNDTNAATTPWSTVGFTGAPASTTPGPNNPVFIGQASSGRYHTVTVTQNGARAGSLQIDRGATLDVTTTTNHNFGALPDAQVGGAGRLRVSTTAATAEFPGGDFGTFLQPSGGTVDYYTTGSQSFALPLTSATNLALGTYRTLHLNPGSGQTITLPARDLRVYSNLRVGTQATATGLTLLSDAAAGNLAIDSVLTVQNGTLRYANGTARALTVGTNLIISANAAFDAAGTGAAVANTLRVGGSLTNNGTLNLNPGSSKLAGLTFVNALGAALTGTTGGALTNLAALTLDKGTSQSSVLTVNVAGTLTTPSSGWLTLSHGTLRFAKTGGLLTVHDAASAYFINEAAGLTVDAPGATVTVATANNASADLQLGGYLRVLQGTLQVGNPAIAAGNDLEYASAGAPSVTVTTGGSLLVNGQVRRSLGNTVGALRYDQSGGSVVLGGVGASAASNNERGIFEILGKSSMFRLSGGTLALRRSNQNASLIADLYLRPDSTVVTGGQVLLGLPGATASATVSVDTSVPLYDLRVEAGSAAAPNTGLLVSSPLVLRGSLDIANDYAFFNASGLDVSLAQNLLNSNSSTNTTLTGGGYRPGTATQTTTFTGTGAAAIVQQLTAASGTATNTTTFANLVVAPTPPAGSVQLQAGRNIYVVGTLTLLRGTLADNGQLITAAGPVVNSATHTSSGSGALVLGGSANQPVGGNGTGRFGNLTLSNGTGATTTANQEVTGTLTLGAGVFTIGSNLLWLSNPAATAVSGFSNTKYIQLNGIVADAGLRKSFPTGASNFTFPLGTGSKYTPAQFNVTANGAAGTLTVRAVNAPHPSTTDAADKELAYYWKVSSTGFSNPTVTHTYNFLAADARGTKANYVTGRFVPNAWTPPNGLPGTVNATVNTMTLSGVNYLNGDYTAGESSEFAEVKVYYSRTFTAGTAAGANWNEASAWTFNADGSDSSPLPLVGPTTANPVVILANHLINSNGGNRNAASLSLLGTLDLGIGTANNFNTVSGPGTLRIGSAVFPAGNYASFVAGDLGGTVEYTGDVQLPARDTYFNLAFSGNNAKQLSNLDLTINGALTVVGSNTTVNNPTSQNLTLTSTTAGANLAGVFNLNNGNLTLGASLVNSGQLTLGAGQLSTGRSLTNSGTLRNGAGPVQVGTSLFNSGTYLANTDNGTLSIGTNFTNTNVFTGGAGAVAVGGSLANQGTFGAGTGAMSVSQNFTNSGTYSATTNSLLVSGNFTNAAAGTFTAGASQLGLVGNFTNAGTFQAGTSQVLLLADGARTLTGTTTFYDLQKLGQGQLTLGTSTDVTVSDLLTLQAGGILTGPTNTLRLTNTATQPIVGTSSTAYVAGRLAMSLPDAAASSRSFPVGNGGVYRPVTIKAEASTSPVVLVEMINSAPGGEVDNSLSNLSRARYYRIQLLSGVLNQPSVQLSFNTAGVVDEEVNVPGNLRVAASQGSSGPWSNAGGAGVYSPAFPGGYTISAPTVINTNSFFTLASTNAVDNPLSGLTPLPVMLVRFTATPQGSAVRLAWVTASEQRSAYFGVERAADGVAFREIDRVAAAGTSTAHLDYSSFDARPLAGRSYYRLHLVDTDGKHTYSPVVTVQLGEAPTPSLTVYPNPAAATGFQALATGLRVGATLTLTDNLGRVVWQQTQAAPAAEWQVAPARPLARGLYHLRLNPAAGASRTLKVVVE